MKILLVLHKNFPNKAQKVTTEFGYKRPTSNLVRIISKLNRIFKLLESKSL